MKSRESPASMTKRRSSLKRTPTAHPPPVEKPKPQPIIVSGGNRSYRQDRSSIEFQEQPDGPTFSRNTGATCERGRKAALPAGSTVSGTVVTAKAKGKVKGEGQLDLSLTSISVGGHTYQIQTSVLSNTVKGKGKRTAATTGGGAAGGALIGGIAGGGKGAAIGAGVGAAAGFLGGTLTGNKQIEVPAESALSFTLAQPLTLPPPEQMISIPG